jgi:hypothetical protein
MSAFGAIRTCASNRVARLQVSVPGSWLRFEIQPAQDRPNGVTFDKRLGFNCCHLMSSEEKAPCLRSLPAVSDASMQSL